jgi:hypothetical protein
LLVFLQKAEMAVLDRQPQFQDHQQLMAVAVAAVVLLEALLVQVVQAVAEMAVRQAEMAVLELKTQAVAVAAAVLWAVVQVLVQTAVQELQF